MGKYRNPLVAAGESK